MGPYTVRVDALIGEGGFASIYRVQDQTTTQVRLPLGGDAQEATGEDLTANCGAPHPHYSVAALDFDRLGSRRHTCVAMLMHAAAYIPSMPV